MIPTVGLIVAIYAIARLLQVPVEASTLSRRSLLLLMISLPAILGISVLAASLTMSGASSMSTELTQTSASTKVANEAAYSEIRNWQQRLQAIVNGSGKLCDTVLSAFHQGLDPTSRENAWNLRCANGDSYAIRLKEGQPPRVESCMNATPRCFTQF